MPVVPNERTLPAYSRHQWRLRSTSREVKNQERKNALERLIHHQQGDYADLGQTDLSTRMEGFKMSVLEVQRLSRGKCQKQSRRAQSPGRATRSAPASSQKIESLRRQITRGNYDFDLRLSVSIDRLIEAVLK